MECLCYVVLLKDFCLSGSGGWRNVDQCTGGPMMGHGLLAEWPDC